MKKVLVITGNRSEYGLLLPVLLELQKSKKFTVRLLVTGAHTQKKYGYTIDLIKKDNVPIAHVVPIPEQASMLEALTLEINGIAEYCQKEKPDIVLVWGDRDEGFAGAIVAGHMGIPLAHIGGGDITGSGVDEPIRHAISKFAHVHFPVSKASARTLLKLGEDKRRIHMVGTTAFDQIRSSSLMPRSVLAHMLEIDPKKPWILFIQHPTPLDREPLIQQIQSSLKALEKLPGEKIILYPNSDTGSDIFISRIKAYEKTPGFIVRKTLPRQEYLSLLKEAAVMVGNSSSGIVEAGFLKKPVVDVGNRQRGREHGANVLHAPYNSNAIEKMLRKALMPAFAARVKKSSHPYGSGGASRAIVRKLERLVFDETLLHKKL